ncbi:MAG: hypothetical protein R6X12_06030 [bacterium]
MLKSILSVIIACGLSAGAELLVNGSFEQPLGTGWVHTEGGAGTHTSNRAVHYHPDPDYEAMAYQYDNPGWCRLGQTVDVASPALTLTFWASFEHSGGTSTCWPAACFSVSYQNRNGTELGETRYVYSTYATWQPTPTLSLVRVADPAWSEYRLDIAREIADNLPGVSPADIARIEVALYSYTFDG